MKVLRLCLSSLLVVVVMGPAADRAPADQAVLPAIRDTFIRSGTHDDWSTSTLLFARSVTGTPNHYENSLLRFDMDALHPHAVVGDVTVSLYVTDVHNMTPEQWVKVDLYPVDPDRPWLESANWYEYYPPYHYMWTSPGCEAEGYDRGPAEGAAVTFTGDSPTGQRYEWTSDNLRQTVWDWQCGTTANRGWLLRVSEGTGGSTTYYGIRASSREAGPEYEPQLIVDYSQEPIYWAGDHMGSWDTTSYNWTWMCGSTRYVDTDDVYFTGPTDYYLDIVGTVLPHSISVDCAYLRLQGGPIGGNCGLTVGGYAAEPEVLLGSANTFTGDIAVGSGQLVVSANNALGSTSGYTDLAEGATLAFLSGVQYTSPETVLVRGHGGAINSSFQGALGSDGDNLFAGLVYFQGDTTIDVQDGSLTLTNMVCDYDLMGSGSTDSTLSICGNGALNLQNKGLYAGGGTIIDEYATLLANNTTGWATGIGTVTVTERGTLGGEGSVGEVVVEAGGIIAPGNSAGTLTVAGLELADTSRLDFELCTPNILEYNDQLMVEGDLVLDGYLDITALCILDLGSYRVITYTGDLTDNGLLIGDAPAGLAYSIDTSNPGYVYVVVDVPEPTTLTLLTFGMFSLGLAGGRRRRHY